MVRKAHSRKRQVEGFKSPRNSLDLHLEPSYGFCAARDNILYDYHSPTASYAEDYYCRKAPMKKLTSEGTKRPKNKQNAPSLVARLMGVDTLPLVSEVSVETIGSKNETSSGKLIDKRASSVNSFPPSNFTQQHDFGYFGHYDAERDFDHRFSGSVKQIKPKQLREHPQEEELQKFKKEFEAWQATRCKKCSSSMVDVKRNHAPNLLIAQDELNRKKMNLYANSHMVLDSDGPSEAKHFANNSYHSTAENESLRPDRILKASQLMNSEPKVIINSSADKIDINEDSWNMTPCTLEDRNNIEDLLEEVKERLESEIQGKCSKRSYGVRGGGIETPYREKPRGPSEITQCTAKHVIENITTDLEMNLLSLESTSSYRSKDPLNETSSPDLISRNTKRCLAERLRDILEGEEMGGGVPRVVRTKSRLSLSDNDNSVSSQSRDNLWMNNKANWPRNYTNGLKRENKSFRCESVDGGFHHEEQSPRNLVRSLSAAFPGALFGKLLLEDRKKFTGAQIMRKHEFIEKVKSKKSKFNIKEKVSSCRYSLTLRGKLFRRRFKSTSRLDQSRNNLMKDASCGPTLTMSFYETQENSMEVPPSPASVCSSVHEELWRPEDCLSPVSSLGGDQLDDGDTDVSHAFEDINSNLKVLRRKLNKLVGSDPNEGDINEQNPTDVETDIKDETEAYVRDLLIASGLYDGSFTQSLSKWDPLGKPISDKVFREVEDTRKANSQMHGKEQRDKLNHMMILDLVNDTIPVILRQPVNMSKYVEKASGHNFKEQPPQGRELLSFVWNIIRAYVHPRTDRSWYSLDDVLLRDLNSEPWSRLIDDGENAIGREIECLIIGDMIGEMVNDSLA